jgi:hypothetical protein
MAMFNSDDPDAGDKMRQMFGPGQVDGQIRQAIHVCWMLLPDDKKTVDELESQFRRIVDRAIHDLREDSDAFGLGK